MKLNELIEAMDRHRLKTTLIYWALHLGLFFLVEAVVQNPVWIVHCAIDDLIPFSKYAIIFYFLWFVEIGITCALFWLKGTKKEFVRFYLLMFGSVVTTLLFYFIVPNGLDMRPEITGSDPFSLLVSLIHASDTPNNVCPSIHVIVSVIIDLEWQNSHWVKEKKTKTESVLLHIAAIGIIVSTMLLKQHSFIDVAAGLVYALLWEMVVNKLTEKIAW